MENINFEAELEKHIVCIKCRMVVIEPHESCCCGTLYCLECTKLLPHCLKCKAVSKFRENSFIKRILNQTLLNCSFNCGQKFSYQNIKDHMTSCEMRKYNCNICITKESTFIGNKKELLSHLLEKHENEIIDINDKYSMIKKNMEKKEGRANSGFDKDYNLDDNYEYNPGDEYSYGEDQFHEYGY
jgi:hypothetical protein